MRRSLRNVLCLDATFCVVMGGLLSGWATDLELFLGLPAALIVWIGLLLFPSAALMLIAARSARPNSALVLLIVYGNVAWVVASVLLAVGVPAVPAPWGRAFLVIQGGAVAVLAWQEWLLRPVRVSA